MPNTRFEDYDRQYETLPFVLHSNIERTALKRSDAHNWHEDLEIQWCTEGEGYVLLNGESLSFRAGDIIVVNSNLIHYTGTDSRLVYHCIILDPSFCRRMGLPVTSARYTPHIASPALFDALCALRSDFHHDSLPCRTAQLHSRLLTVLIDLAAHHTVAMSVTPADSKAHARVRRIIRFIRTHYAEKIILSRLASEFYLDPHTLCRDFKQLTGSTITDYTNNYRCQRAAALLSEGMTAFAASELCGFSDPAYFSRTFKRYMGAPPSAYHTHSS